MMSSSPSTVASPASNEKMIDAIGKVPYDAASDNEFADDSCSSGTRFGTDAACAGPHNRVSTSSPSEMRSRPAIPFTNGRHTRRLARPMSQSTITLRRSNRSMITPPTVPSRKPGSTRVVMTRLTAAPELLDTRAAMARMAMRPIQSPRLETHCAVQSRKNALVPNTRHGASGRGGSEASDGMNGACG